MQFHRGYLVVDRAGGFVAISDNPDDAATAANRFVGRDGVALWLATALPEDVEVRENQNLEEDIRTAPHKAWELSQIPRIDFHAALRMRPELVVAALNDTRTVFGDPVLSGEPKTIIRSKAKDLVSGNTKMDKVPASLAALVGSDTMGSKGVSLAPHGLSFMGQRSTWIEQRRALITRKEGREPTFCFRAVENCKAACLVASGRHAIADKKGGIPLMGTAYKAKMWRSWMLRHYPDAFMHLVIRGFQQWGCEALAESSAAFGRMNTLSDLPWELICPELFTELPGIQFYDYTKVPGRNHAAELNYHLTFSWSTPKNIGLMSREMALGRNLAVPFFHPDNQQPGENRPGRFVQPRSFMGVPVINGDEHDMRPLDRFHPYAQGGPVVVGLRFKAPTYLDVGGRASRSDFGAFVVDVYETSDDHGNTVFVASQVPAYTPKGAQWVLENKAAVDEARREFEERAAAERARYRARS